MSAENEKGGIPIAPTAYVRLELLKLSHAPGKGAADVISRAEAYEKYVLPGAAKKPAGKPAKARQGKATPRADSK